MTQVSNKNYEKNNENLFKQKTLNLSTDV